MLLLDVPSGRQMHERRGAASAARCYHTPFASAPPKDVSAAKGQNSRGGAFKIDGSAREPFATKRRRKHSTCGLLLNVGELTLETEHGDFRLHVFQNLYTRHYVLALCYGDIHTSKPLLARVHSACITSESFGACDCDCAEQLDLALSRIAQAGRGLLIYLMQEGRGAGYAAKARDRMLVQASNNVLTTFEAYQRLGLESDHRRYNDVAPALEHLGVSAPLRLLTNNPDKIDGLREYGIAVDGAEPIERDASPFNVDYLSAKRGIGHTLVAGLATTKGAELPEPVHAFEPTPLGAASHLIRMASYLVPLRTGECGEFAWFRAHVYFDLLERCERVVLTYGQARDASGPALLVRVQRESLFQRFPLRSGADRRQWTQIAAEIVRHGRGIAVLPSADGHEALASSALRAAPSGNGTLAGRATDEAVFILLRHHVKETEITPLFTSLDEGDARRALSETFVNHGFCLTAPSTLNLHT
jgi:3,4-dihydroxy 2-butanone 4-phosphate synthase / GTP cyclohydrolase II